VVLADLAEFTHLVTRVKIVPAVADDVSLAEVERVRARGFAEKLSMRVLSRAWQMLLKGIAEVEGAGRPIAAAEMVLVRLAYAADLPTPDEVLRSLDREGASTRMNPDGGTAAGPGGHAPVARREVSAVEVGRLDGSRGSLRAAAMTSPQFSTAPAARASDPAASVQASSMSAPGTPALAIGRFEDLIALAVQKRDISIKMALERDVRLVRFEDGRLEIALERGAARTLVNDLARKLSDWTSRRWMVVVSSDAGAPTVKSQAEARHAELKTGVRADPLVQAVLARFPGAEIVEVREPDVPLPSPEPDETSLDPPPAGDAGAYGTD
jgi:DNA polymerase-3 subunit gamma/tau